MSNGSSGYGNAKTKRKRAGRKSNRRSRRKLPSSNAIGRQPNTE